MNLCLFTSNYPYGNSEPFIDNEINHLSKRFNKIYVFSFKEKTQLEKTLPNNVELVSLSKVYHRRKILKSNFLITIKVIFQEINANGLFKSNLTFKISNFLRLLSISDSLATWFEKYNLDNFINYSYWLDDWATVLSILKRKNIISAFICRAHGFDLYNYRTKYKVINYRRFQLENVNKVVTVSKDGCSYLKMAYMKYSDKFFHSYLGTNDYGLSIYRPSKKLKILTISRLVPLKRINLLVQILNNITIDLEWVHFGDGELKNELKNNIKLLPKNISVELRGRRENKEMMNFIKNNHFDVFINISEFEGLPVSIMEAISFGIPVFATNAGGTNEIVNSRTGKLFDVNLNKMDLSNSLNNFFKTKYSKEDFRLKVRKYWKENFDSNKNYKKFIDRFLLIDN